MWTSTVGTWCKWYSRYHLLQLLFIFLAHLFLQLLLPLLLFFLSLLQCLLCPLLLLLFLSHRSAHLYLPSAGTEGKHHSTLLCLVFVLPNTLLSFIVPSSPPPVPHSPSTFKFSPQLHLVLQMVWSGWFTCICSGLVHLLSTFLIIAFIYRVSCACHGMGVQVRRQLGGFGAQLLPCGLQESNSGCQAWWHTPLLTEPSQLTQSNLYKGCHQCFVIWFVFFL